MIGAGFDPRPHWEWVQSGGKRGVTRWTPATVDARTNEWLRIRHAIAHGHATLPQVEALRAIRQNPNNADPQVRMEDAEQCLDFFRRLPRLTGNALLLTSDSRNLSSCPSGSYFATRRPVNFATRQVGSRRRLP
jgi:hypothetical protein